MSAIDDPVNVAPPGFLQAIDSIEPGVWGTPCAVTLRDGKHFEAALAHENRRFGDAGDWINPQDIRSVVASPKRMPARFARELYEAGESGMGYHIYVVHLSDGSSFVHMAGGLGIDLVDLPSGYGPDDIVKVSPNAGRGQRGYRQISNSASIDYARPSQRAQ